MSVATVADIERLFADIPLDKVTTSMTINAPAVVLLAFYVVAAERRGIPPEALGGTTQNDMLKEFIAQKEWICGIRPHLRIVRDMLVYCTARMPRWNTISVSGYHIREAGATAVQELALTLADGIGYVELGRAAGLDVDVFAQRLSFFWDVHNDFFEEIAKLRAARRMWARIMRDRFGAKNPRAWLLARPRPDGRGVAGGAAAAQQRRPHDGAGAGGRAGRHAVASHQQLRRDLRAADRGGGHARAAHPAGHRRGDRRPGGRGSAGRQLLRRAPHRPHGSRGQPAHRHHRRDGGHRHARSRRAGPSARSPPSAYRYQRQIDAGERAVVGVNRNLSAEAAEPIPTLKIDHGPERDQVEAVRAVRARRDAARAAEGIALVRAACVGDANIMEAVVEAARRDVTLGEICKVVREVFGEYRDPAQI